MTEKVGIKETLEWVRFICKTAKAAGVSLADGKFEWTEVANFFPALMELPTAIEGSGNVFPELSDLDASELKELQAVIMQELADIPGVDKWWWQLADEIFKMTIPLLNVIRLIVEKVKDKPSV